MELLLLLLVAVSACGAAVAPQEGIFDPTGPVLVLNGTNFRPVVLHKPHAHFVDFYNSFCGFCRRFAPEWTRLALEVAPWAGVVRVAAIDCSTDLNNVICRDFEILAYPSLRFFPADYSPDNSDPPNVFGRHVDHPPVLIDELVKQLRHPNTSFPFLLPKHFENLQEPWAVAPAGAQRIFLIFEPTISLIGSQIILDLMNTPNIVIYTLPDTSSLRSDKQITVYELSKDQAMIAVSSRSTREEIRDDIAQYLGIMPIVTAIPEPEKPIVTVDKSIPTIVGTAVFQADLEGGLRYTLAHEATKKRQLDAAALDALENYLRVLVEHFPSEANTKPFLIDLLDAVVKRVGVDTGDGLFSIMAKLEDKHAPVYSTDLQWVACRGSTPHFRGFTCSLWTIFHVLTVSEASRKELNQRSQVLEAMHGYVKNFFGCTECASHFGLMVERMPFSAFDGVGDDRGIYWLWHAHNQVNARLAGDSTEDPHYPKRQFPYEEDCPTCRYPNGNWNVAAVMKYYKAMYGAGNIQLIGGTTQRSAAATLSGFDVTLMGFLYVYCFAASIFIVRLFFSKGSYQRRARLLYDSGKP